MKAKHKKFDSVKWVREVRDKFYNEHRNLKGADYLEAIRKGVRKDILSPEKGKRARKNIKEHV